MSLFKKGKCNFIIMTQPSPCIWISLILCLCLVHALRAFLALPNTALPLSSECMSHMPHRHSIVGLCTARGTSHSQDLLLHIPHPALKPAGQEWGKFHPFNHAQIPVCFKTKHQNCIYLTVFGNKELRIGTFKRRMHTFNQASNSFLWLGGVYWKTIMREGAFLSSKAKGQWRNSLTRLTFTLVNPLGSSEEVKIRPSQCWGWDQLMSEHLCRNGCVRIRGQQ